MQTEHETLLEKQKKEFEEMIEKINETIRNVTKLQKSHDVKKNADIHTWNSET